MRIYHALLSCIFFTTLLYTEPFNVLKDKTGNSICFIYDHSATLTMHPLNALQTCLIDIEQFLHQVSPYNKPVIIHVPGHLEHVSTLAVDAPYTEGARVALTWASAFNRFEQLGSIDIRIVHSHYERYNNHITKAILSILQKQSSDYSSIYSRVHMIDDNTCFDCVDIENVTIQPLSLEQGIQIRSTTCLGAKQKNQQTFLITGAAGFIGSHLCIKLLSAGHRVVGIDNFACCNRTNLLPLLDDANFYFIQADITQPLHIEGSIDCVVHLASIPSPKYYYAMPIETLRTGLIGTKNTLEIARIHNARYMFASTSEVYGDPEVSPQSEDYCGNVDPIGMRSQYDQSKRGAETLIKIYAESFKLDARIARIFNTYGPGMQLDDGRVITNFIHAHLKGFPLVIHGDGNQTRSFAYVDDTVEGLYKLITNNQLNYNTSLQNKIFNIGTPEEFTINELAHIFNEILLELDMKPAEIKHIPQFDHTDPKKRLPDISRSNQLLHFAPQVRIKKGLKKTLGLFIV